MDEPTPSRRRWPKITIRRLLVGITISGVYFSTWPSSLRNAGPDVVTYALDNREAHTSWTFYGGYAIFPLVFREDERQYLPNDMNVTFRRYYFWCFGFVWRTPVEYEIPFR